MSLLWSDDELNVLFKDMEDQFLRMDSPRGVLEGESTTGAGAAITTSFTAAAASYPVTVTPVATPESTGLPRMHHDSAVGPEESVKGEEPNLDPGSVIVYQVVLAVMAVLLVLVVCGALCCPVWSHRISSK